MRKLRGGHDTDDDDDDGGGSPTTSPSVVTYEATCPDPVHGVPRLKHSRLLLKKIHYDISPLWIGGVWCWVVSLSTAIIPSSIRQRSMGGVAAHRRIRRANDRCTRRPTSLVATTTSPV